MTITIPIDALWLIGGVLIGMALTVIAEFYWHLMRNLFE